MPCSALRRIPRTRSLTLTLPAGLDAASGGLGGPLARVVSRIRPAGMFARGRDGGDLYRTNRAIGHALATGGHYEFGGFGGQLPVKR